MISALDATEAQLTTQLGKRALAISLRALPETFSMTPRLRNLLRRPSSQSGVWLETVGEYSDALPGIEKMLLRTWGVGSRTVHELSSLVRSIANAAATAEC